MTSLAALLLGLGLGLCIYPTLHWLLGSWTGIVGVGLVIGAVLSWWRRAP